MNELVFEALTGVSVIAPEPEAETPVNGGPTMEDVQSNVAPIEVDGVKFNGTPLQISWIIDAGGVVI